MKGKRLKYNFSGKWEDVNYFLRQYSVDNVIKKINRESVRLFEDSNESDIPATRRVNYSLYNKGSLIPIKNEALIMAWSLIDLAYYMIVSSNDYRGKIIECDEELYLLQVAVDNYREREEQEYIDSDKSNFFFYLWGVGGEQFKFERPALMFGNYARELYILFDVNKSSDYNISKIVAEEVGVSWKKVLIYQTIAWFGFTKFDTINEIKDKLHWKNEKNSIEFDRVIERYTADYCEIRKSAIKRQIFYTKPYVKTSKGEIIAVSTYTNFFLFEHSILWIVRDYYNKKGSQEFVNYFGVLFEKYFEELLADCLFKDEYCRIEEDKEKRTDWRIEIGCYKFLVEQKSTIMRLGAKQQFLNVSDIRKFGKDTIIKAIKQLKATEDFYGDGRYIKIILLYDDYLKPEILEHFFEMDECKVENDNYYWLLTIEEIEMLLSVYKNDKTLFYKIIKEKIDREENHSIEGKSIIQLLNENKIVKNDYLAQEKIKKYMDIVTNNARDFL